MVGWWGSCIDIHDRRELEGRSRDLAARLTWTLESISDAVIGLDPDWRVTVMNENAATLLQRSRESLMGRVVWKEFPDAVGSVFQTAVRTRGPRPASRSASRRSTPPSAATWRSLPTRTRTA